MNSALQAVHAAVLAIVSATLLASSPVEAQVFKYRDPATGRVIMTDKPPAGRSAKTPAADAGAEAAEAAGTETAPAADGGVDPRLAARKREAEAKQRAADEASVAAERDRLREACTGIRRNLAMLESGQRIATMNDAGEREFMSDERREREIERTRAELQHCER